MDKNIVEWSTWAILCFEWAIEKIIITLQAPYMKTLKHEFDTAKLLKITQIFIIFS